MFYTAIPVVFLDFTHRTRSLLCFLKNFCWVIQILCRAYFILCSHRILGLYTVMYSQLKLVNSIQIRISLLYYLWVVASLRNRDIRNVRMIDVWLFFLLTNWCVCCKKWCAGTLVSVIRPDRVAHMCIYSSRFTEISYLRKVLKPLLILTFCMLYWSWRMGFLILGLCWMHNMYVLHMFCK